MRNFRLRTLLIGLLSVAVSGCSGSFSNQKQGSTSALDSTQVDADARDFQLAIEKSSLAILSGSENLESTQWKALGHFENAMVERSGTKPEFLNPKNAHSFQLSFDNYKNLNECLNPGESCTQLLVPGIGAELRTACVIQKIVFSIHIEAFGIWPSDTLTEFEVFRAQLLDKTLAGCSSEGDADASALLAELESADNPAATIYLYGKQYLYLNVGEKTWVFTSIQSPPAK